MCDYTQIEYCCQHFRFIVQKWCSIYERTNKPCHPNVTHLEIRNDELCCMLLLIHYPTYFPRSSRSPCGLSFRAPSL
ncbi:hypothetical protein F5X96DRAFT_409896 [Biscogniauxia mediterranea]|nr:hypothetical protein F5X96DRAFT_409896 [Biscogniauxia mediterranea]